MKRYEMRKSAVITHNVNVDIDVEKHIEKSRSMC